MLVGLIVGMGFVALVSMAFSVSEPEISKEKAVEIAVNDMTTNYIKNPPAIKIYAVEDVEEPLGAVYPTIETFLEEGENYIIPMAHTSAVDRAYYFVNPETRSLEECQIPYCTFREEGMNALTGRYAWIVDLVTQCKEYPHHGADIKYAVDAKTGQILWRHFASPEQQEQQEPFVCSGNNQ